jgi:hypothetical protein
MLKSFDLPPGFENEALATAGATTGQLKITHTSLFHYLEQIEAFPEPAGLSATAEKSHLSWISGQLRCRTPR